MLKTHPYRDDLNESGENFSFKRSEQKSLAMFSCWTAAPRKRRNRIRLLAIVFVFIFLYLTYGSEKSSAVPSSLQTSPPYARSLPTSQPPTSLNAATSQPPTSLNAATDTSDRVSALITTTGFRTTELSGFVNNGNPGEVKCDEIRYKGTISYSVDQTLDEDLEVASSSLKDHPLVQKHGPGGWTQFVGSSVWLPDHGVYLLVSRLSYRSEPIFSVLRGRIFDSDWNEIHDYTINWDGKPTIFPTNFDIDLDYKLNGKWYGPEDPRIILEDGVKGAEPVIAFNQISVATNWKRAMWIYRPFTNVLTLFTIQGMQRPRKEKNWAPIFYRSIEDIQNEPRDGVHVPSKYIYFIYEMEEISVLKCHISTGLCRLTYWADIPYSLLGDHETFQGAMRGGTQFVPVPFPTAPGTQIYVSMPRTHVNSGCNTAVYRPEIVVLAVCDGNFHWLYASEPLDLMGFDQPFLKVEKPLISKNYLEDDEERAKDPTSARWKEGASKFQFPAVWNPCKENRIFISNSIASWDVDTADGMDTMTITFSVQDQTIQTARIRGVLSLIRSIPSLQEWILHDTSTGGKTFWNARWEALGRDVIQCSIQSAYNYSVQLKKVFDKNEENLNEFIVLNPDSNMAKKHHQNKLLEAVKTRNRKASKPEKGNKRGRRPANKGR